MRKLQSMVDYVLEQPKTITSTFVDLIKVKNSHIKIINYANFLSMPLTLSMFVPVDEDGNVLEQPKIIEISRFQKPNKSFESFQLDYQKTLDNVLFEGFELIKTYGDYASIQKEGVEIFWYNSNSNIGENKWKRCRNFEYSKIEDLVKYNLTLTESSITKYQI